MGTWRYRLWPAFQQRDGETNDKPGTYVVLADVDGTKPHRYPLAFDPNTGELMWDEETDPDETDINGNPIIPGTLVSHTWNRFDGGMGHTVEDYATVVKVKSAELAAKKGDLPEKAAVIYLRRTAVA